MICGFVFVFQYQQSKLEEEKETILHYNASVTTHNLVKKIYDQDYFRTTVCTIWTNYRQYVLLQYTVFQVTDSSINIVRTRKNKLKLQHIQTKLC